MPFEITISNAKVFQSCIDAIATLIDEGEFEITEKGITLRAMDPSQIAMVDFSMPKHSFEDYRVTPKKIGMNLEALSKIMGRTRAGEKLVMKLDESGSRMLLTFKGQSTRKFTMPLLDLRGATPKEPQIDFDGKVDMNSSLLKEAIKDTALVSSHVVLQTDKNSFLIESSGDRGEVKINTEKSNDAILDFKVSTESRAMFPLEYLNDILKAADTTTNISLELKSNAPLKVKYKIGDAELAYYLAPRIETE
jgi:proliferating cell nuclear antigen